MHLFLWNLRLIAAFLIMCPHLGLLSPCLSAQQPMQQSWERLPDLGVDWIAYAETSVAPEFIDKYLNLLSNPDQQEQLEAAQWFISVSSLLSKDVKQSVLPTVFELLTDTSAPRQLRQVVASAAVALITDPASSAERLWRLTAEDVTIRPFVENALISWKHDLAQRLWRERLSIPNLSENDLSLALRGLAAINARDAADAIARLIEREQVAQPLLLQACDALGQLSSSGYEDLANKCLNSTYSAGELMAARIIRNHSGSQAAAIAARLMNAKLQPARRLAFQWYSQNSPQELASMLKTLKDDVDSGIRWLTIDQLCGPDDAQVVKLLGECLRDPLPANRQRVRDGLIKKAQIAKLKPVVFEVLQTSLQTDFGAGSEEAIEAVVALKADQFNAQLLELLDHPLTAIQVRAAWGLQELGVQEADQLAAVFSRCLKLTEAFENKTLSNERPVEVQWAYLLSVLGHARHKPAEAMLRKYVAKNVFPTIARASGIWSLGNVMAGSRDQALASALVARMLDSGPEGEDFSIRYVSALAVGYIASPDSRKALIDCPEKRPSPVGYAVDWALTQINSAVNGQ